MPQLPGLIATPTVLFNSVLGLAPEREVTVRGPDRVAVVVPMFDEEDGAEAALRSVLEQRSPADSVAVSVNGGSDATADVVANTLRRLGYHPTPQPNPTGQPAQVRLWHGRGSAAVVVVEFAHRTGKAESLNALVASGLVEAERVLVVDGDTVLDPGFVAAFRDGFYRARLERRGARRVWVVEDVALQSGAATSRLRAGAAPAAAFISRARDVEYAFSAVLRRGQTRRLGASAVFGRSRLYTVVGCGFALRRDAFPIPTDTLTEDHDLTLAVQGAAVEERSVDADTLWARGFQVVVAGRSVDPRSFWGQGAQLLLRRGADARFLNGALMHTQDPPHVGGYVRQVERWTGGGLQNALKRFVGAARTVPLAANVRFAALTAQLENLLGLALLAYLPLWLGMRVADPRADLPLIGLLLWLALDLSLTAAIAAVGFVRRERARAVVGPRLVGRVAKGVLLGVGPLVALRYLHAVCYLAAASRVLPAFVVRARRPVTATVTWERPHSRVRHAAHLRTASVGAVMAVYALAGFSGVASLAAPVDAAAHEAWQRTRDARGNDLLADYRVLPIERARRTPEPSVSITVAAQRETVPRGASEPEGLSHYCPVGAVASAATAPRRLSDDAPAFVELSPWGLLTLARLAPLLAHLEEAATAYDVPASVLLQVLLNESFLDPLAHGPTDDVGLSQVTADALALVQSLSADTSSGFANARLVAAPSSLYDPDFSMCAGAAKLAWARAQPGGHDDGVAYARYVNPIDGVVEGRVSARHAPLVAAFEAVGPLSDAMASVVAAYRTRPEVVGAAAAALLAVSDEVAAGAIDLEAAYRRIAELVAEFGVRDGSFYVEVLRGLYGDGVDDAREGVGDATPTLAASSD